MELVNVGIVPDDGSGDPLRTAFVKINNNFSRLAALQPDSHINMDYNAINTSNTSYYIGVNYSGAVTINLHVGATGQHLIIKDESGNCASNPITLVGTIDNSANATLAINNGALSLIYSNGWRII